MRTYLSESVVSLSLPFADAEGRPLNPISASYRVHTETGEEVVAQTALDVTSSPVSAEVTIPSEVNDLDGAVNGIRAVELTMETESGTVKSVYRYILESPSILVLGETSFQTYSEAILEANYMIGVDMWMNASEREQRASLIEAYHNICKLNFVEGSVHEMTAEEFASMDSRLLSAIKKAQVAEADFLLGGETVGDKRRIGLMSETVGESSNMFRPGKPLKLPVSERAISYLSGHITWTVGIRR